MRGTQSLVHTLGRCWRRPSLTGLEVLWRWVFGIAGAVGGLVRCSGFCCCMREHGWEH